jgi:hypothetical protein
VKALNPEFGVGDIAKELGRRWSDVDPELKSKYEAMAEKDKARYDRVSCNLFFPLSFSPRPLHIICEVEFLLMFIL